MSTEDNKALSRKLLDGLNRNDVAFIDELCTPDFVLHDPAALADGTAVVLIAERNTKSTCRDSSPPCRANLRLTNDR